MKFPIELYKEGKSSFFAPDLSKYRIPQDAPVFYNPEMEFNRDLSIICIQTYQNFLNRKITIGDPLSGVGVRGIRYANEVQGIETIAVNDINKDAYNLILKNIAHAKVDHLLVPSNTDANNMLSQIASSHQRLDIIDLDPFGSPVIFLDSAIRALKKVGGIFLTATDMQVLCGIEYNACARKYGGYPIKTNYCHEIAIRLLIGCLSTVASRFNFAIDPLISFSKIHYVRTFVKLIKNNTRSNRNLERIGFISHCFSCGMRWVNKGLVYKDNSECPICKGMDIKIAGPLWVGNLHNNDFLSRTLQVSKTFEFKTKKEIISLLSTLLLEADGQPTYYDIHLICKRLKVSPPKIDLIIKKLKDLKYIVSRTHFSPTSIKTNANIKIISELLKTK
ncbi:MAG: tRNA (guanine(10)-N(2))-dimethyltransferase [Candidatus Helarchaeota archaeon]